MKRTGYLCVFCVLTALLTACKRVQADGPDNYVKEMRQQLYDNMAAEAQKTKKTITQ